MKSNEFGLDVNALKIRLEEGDTFINPINSILENAACTPRKKRKVLFRPKLVYIVPTHSNPQGLTMSQEAREELVRLAYQYKFHIIAGVYHILSWSKSLCQIDFVKLKGITWRKIQNKLLQISERLFLCLVSLKFSRQHCGSVGLKPRILSCERNFQSEGTLFLVATLQVFLQT